MHYD